MRSIRTSRTGRPIARTHPLTGLPLAPLGHRRDGSPIWPIMGGSGEGGEGGEGGDDGGTDTGDEGKADEGDEGKAPENETADAKAARLEAEVSRLRKENASDRTNAKTKAAEDARKAVVDDIAKALGLKEGDKAPTVEELKAQLTEQSGQTEEARAAARDTQAELIVWRNATELKVDPQALTDSRAFASAIKNLDPSDPKKFEKAVKEAAQEAVKNNPRLAAQAAASSSSADHSGGPGGGASKTPKSLNDAVAAHYGTA